MSGAPAEPSGLLRVGQVLAALFVSVTLLSAGMVVVLNLPTGQRGSAGAVVAGLVLAAFAVVGALVGAGSAALIGIRPAVVMTALTFGIAVLTLILLVVGAFWCARALFGIAAIRRRRSATAGD